MIFDFRRDGVELKENFFEKEVLSGLLLDLKYPYIKQFKNNKINLGSFDEDLFCLFRQEFETFSNCGKHNQHGCTSLYRLATSQKIMNYLSDLGMKKPFLATRPVVMQNHTRLSKSEAFYKTPAHQDWGSMRSSKNSVVVWIPLQDVGVESGPVHFVPGSHNAGALETHVIEGFSCTDAYPEEDFKFTEMKLGDALIFSTFLVHKSGEITNNKIRWSCQFRYCDMEEDDFVERKYEFNYLYSPKIKIAKETGEQ